MKFNFKANNDAVDWFITLEADADQSEADHFLNYLSEYKHYEIMITNRTNGRQALINLQDIIAVQVNRNNLEIITVDAHYEIRSSLTQFIHKLNHDFIQISQSSVIQLSKLTEVKSNWGNAMAVLDNGVEIEISRRYLTKLKNRLEESSW
ncbi:LytTR family transcriptional regulator [Weissella coleopterorum]|uniref:LytTR family transcriptional regulator n=1 Tax=Weissella coleopterorum TaxID=2714949 RepID=A0A6G8B0G4_9LACO|nr:LytTR family DNA-binding domain-containing protein [Weissella coleopterorum]QIL50705.1 LytTR family transcriptional regulator [Weissella coleopterorum]